jgi:hypothetical protein
MNIRLKQILRTYLFTAVVLSTGAMLAPLAAQDIAGHWIVNVDLDAGSGEVSFVFEVEDGKITGTYAGAFGEAELMGTIEGNVVNFTFDAGDAGTATYSGVVDGDTMTGECEYGAAGAGTFEGTKQSG